MGCGASSGRYASNDVLDHRRSVEAAEGRRLPVKEIERRRSALLELVQPTQSAGSAGALKAAQPKPRRVLMSDAPVPREQPLSWDQLSRSGWARGVAGALRRQHEDSEMGEVLEGGHSFAQYDLLAEHDAAADQLFWGTTSLKKLPLSWRMAVAAIQRLRAFGGLAAGLPIFDHDCSDAGLNYAQWVCDMADTGRSAPMEQAGDGWDGEEGLLPASIWPLDNHEGGCDLGGTVEGGRTPWDVLAALIADPSHRRRLPLWNATQSFGVAFAHSSHKQRTHACGLFPQFPPLPVHPAEAVLPSGRSVEQLKEPAYRCPRRFVAFPPAGDTLAPRDCGYHCEARPFMFAPSSGLIVSIIFTQPEDIQGFLRADAEWLDVTNPPPTRPQSGTPVEFWQMDPKSTGTGMTPMIDQILLGANEILAPAKLYRVAVTLTLTTGTERLVWEFRTAPAVLYRVGPPPVPVLIEEELLDEEEDMDADMHDEAGEEMTREEFQLEQKAARADERYEKKLDTVDEKEQKRLLKLEAKEKKGKRKRALELTDSGGGLTTERDDEADLWPFPLAMALVSPSDHMEFSTGDYVMPVGWWCRQRKITGAGSTGNSVTRLILPAGGIHVMGSLVLEHVVLVQRETAAPVLWVHEESELKLSHAKVIGEGVRFCVGTNSHLEMDHIDFREWVAPRPGLKEGADNVCVYLQAGGTLLCGDGNVFSHPTSGERISNRRPCVLAASPNCLWPHPATEFASSVELEQLGHGWVWPLPHLGKRMPNGWRRDGQRDDELTWPQQWHVLEGLRGGVRPHNSMALVIASTQPGDVLLLGAGEFELPENWWCYLGGIHGVGAAKTVLRMPAFSPIYFAGGLNGGECEIRDCTIEVRAPTIWAWMLEGMTLRIRGTAIRRVGHCGGRGDGGGRFCVAPGARMVFEGPNDWRDWSKTAENGERGGVLVECLRGGVVAGSVPKVDREEDAKTVENVFNTRIPEGETIPGPTTLVHSVGTGRTLELKWLRYQWDWPVPPPVDEIMDDDGKSAADPDEDKSAAGDDPENPEAPPPVSPARIQSKITNARGEELDANGQVMMEPNATWKVMGWTSETNEMDGSAGAPSMIGQMIADRQQRGGENKGDKKADKKKAAKEKKAKEDEDSKDKKKYKKKGKKGKDAELEPDASNPSSALAINLEPEPVNLNLRQLEASQLMGTDAPVAGGGAANCELALSSVREKDHVTIGAGKFEMPRYWWATQMSGAAKIQGQGADKTVLYLPPGGVWFGGGEEGRIPGGPPANLVETKRVTVERGRKKVLTVQDVTLVRSAADHGNDAPLLKVYGQTLELLRVKIVAAGTMGGGHLRAAGDGRLLLKQVDLRDWKVALDPEDLKTKKHEAGKRIAIWIDKNAEFMVSAIITPGDRKLGARCDFNGRIFISY